MEHTRPRGAGSNRKKYQNTVKFSSNSWVWLRADGFAICANDASSRCRPLLMPLTLHNGARQARVAPSTELRAA
eukprot:6196297-Pleurochrysis_carterae.AAC.3